MRGFQPAHGAKTKGGGRPKFANGGPVRGPGTGTSDEVQDEVPEGTYIMPADSTETVGEQQLAGMGRDVPVSLSNGEFKMPPEQVHAIGVQALDQMKNATHTPVGFALGARAAQQEAGEPRMFFADGGVVDEVRKRAPISPSNIFPQGHPSAGASVYGSGPEFGSGGQFARVPDTIGQQPGRTAAPVAQPAAPQAQVQRSEADRQALVSQIPTGRGLPAAPFEPPPVAAPAARPPATAGAGPDLGAAARSAAGFVAGAFPNTANAIRESAADARTAYQQAGMGAALGQSARVAATPLIGLADDVATGAAKLLDPAAQALKTFVTGDSTPIGQDAAAPTPAPAAPTPARAAPGAPQAGAAPAPGAAAPAPALGMPAAVPAVAPADTAQAQPVAGMPGVFRSGNSYSDSEAGAVAGAAPRGLPSARNMAAADALAERSQAESLGRVTAARGFTPGFTGVIGQTSGVGNMWSRSPEQQQRDAAISASSITNPAELRRFMAVRQVTDGNRAQIAQGNNQTALAQTQMQGEVQRDLAALREQGDMGRAVMREAGDTGRTVIREKGENGRAAARNAVDERRVGVEEQVRGFDIRKGQREERLYQRYGEAKTPEARAAIAQEIRDLSGKATNPKDDLMVVGGGQEWDTTANTMRNVPQRVFDARTRQFVGQGGQAALPALKDNPAAMAIVNNQALSKEQRAANLRQLGYN